MKPMPTVKQMPQIVAVLRPHITKLLVHMAYAQLKREDVDKIQKKVLAEQCYYGRKHTGEQFRITDPKISYQMDDQSAATYFAKLNAIHLASGYKDAAKGFCPALVAEHDQTKAEWALIDAAHPFFGVTNDALLCGTKTEDGLKTRQKYLDLLIGLVVNHK